MATRSATFKNRRLKLPREVTAVFDDYVKRYVVTDALFPYTPRWITDLLRQAAKQARVNKPVNVSLLRDMFVVRSAKRGQKLDDVFAKLGLSKKSHDDARKKYAALTREAL